MPRLALHWQITLGIVLAIAAGYLTGTESSIGGVTYYSMYAFVGTLFLNALKMVIVPLVTASIIASMANLGDEEGLGRLGGKTLGFYACSSLAAILVGLLVVNLVQPGANSEDLLGKTDSGELAQTLERIEGRTAGDVVEVFVRMIPPNVIAAAAEGQLLGLIFFSLLFGYFISHSGTAHKDQLKGFFQGVMDVMTAITMWVMKFAPIGVFGLVAKTVADTGFAAFQPLMLFFITVVAALAIHVFVSLPLALTLIGKIRPKAHFEAMSPALLTAFSTASSSATLPLTMECVEERAGVSKKVGSFVLPLGATVNMDGTALYECVAAMFIAQVYGIDLSLGQQFIIVLTALLTSIGVAGIPAASLVAISVILGVIGLPLEGIGLLLVTDRILDMMRTAANVFGDSCAAVVIARTEGETTRVGR